MLASLFFGNPSCGSSVSEIDIEHTPTAVKFCAGPPESVRSLRSAKMQGGRNSSLVTKRLGTISRDYSNYTMLSLFVISDDPRSYVVNGFNQFLAQIPGLPNATIKFFLYPWLKMEVDGL